jgi:hypothetical protein
MPFNLYIDNICPKCQQPVMLTIIELHPTQPDLAIHNFQCTDCGLVKGKIVSLKPGKPSPGLAA